MMISPWRLLAHGVRYASQRLKYVGWDRHASLRSTASPPSLAAAIFIIQSADVSSTSCRSSREQRTPVFRGEPKCANTKCELRLTLCIFLLASVLMYASYNRVGDRYTGCGHFVALYETGEVTDCMSEDCKTSSAHKHKTAKNCGCPAVSPGIPGVLYWLLMSVQFAGEMAKAKDTEHVPHEMPGSLEQFPLLSGCAGRHFLACGG